jgi:hypothetical protein
LARDVDVADDILKNALLHPNPAFIARARAPDLVAVG